ncbi:MAG: glycoside hydrolase family 88 protein [Chitinophagaceae bacterium]
MKKVFFIAFLLVATQITAQQNLSERMAATVMNTWKDSFALDGRAARWSYDMGVILKGFEGIWQHTGNAQYYNYIQKMMDVYIHDDGTIKDYKPSEYNIDHINNGKLALLLYKVSGKEKYLKAVNLLRDQLRTHPRTKEGGFWHKKIYPNQMWLDGLYMGEPFYAEYASMAHEDSAFNDIANQFIWMEKHARDAKTGLLYHAWDESKEQKWANKETGLSPHIWARAMGWYGVALVDALDWFPENHPKRKELIAILNRFTNAVEKVQDKSTGLWYDIIDLPARKGNYFEASAASMFVFAIAKAVRMGYLPAAKITIAKKGYAGIVKEFIKEENGKTNLYGTVKVSGLGGNPYRDGSFEYYMSEPVIVNDPKGVGAFILASNEMEMLPTQSLGSGKSVVLDYYFNNEYKKDAFGKMERFHYTWEDDANSGYSMLGSIFRQYGAKTARLTQAPTAALLKNASVYIIVDPDTEKETAKPNYMTEQSAQVIADWVKAGGVLLLMTNDSGNAEFTNFNRLPEKFGLHFNENSINHVDGNQFEMGTQYITSTDAIFKTARRVYIKELATLNIKDPATAHYKNTAGDAIMGVSKKGTGTVFAVGDPWFYNEYVDGRKLPAEFNNYQAATDLVKWLLEQVPATKK